MAHHTCDATETATAVEALISRCHERECLYSFAVSLPQAPRQRIRAIYVGTVHCCRFLKLLGFPVSLLLRGAQQGSWPTSFSFRSVWATTFAHDAQPLTQTTCAARSGAPDTALRHHPSTIAGAQAHKKAHLHMCLSFTLSSLRGCGVHGTGERFVYASSSSSISSLSSPRP